MKLRVWAQIIVFFLFSTLISACDPLFSQNPADSFWSKKFPKQLEWIRSQMREIPSAQQEEIINRVEKDKDRKDLLKVAVIDGGVDIAHPDLINQIAYRVENHQIVGAGYDIMGGGNFGSHVLVDPRLFAFGAKSLRNGKIVDPPESPLKILEQINSRFRDLVIEGIRSDSTLSKSLFAKLSPTSFTFFGFESIRKSPEDYLESYVKNKKNRELVNAMTKPEGLRKSITIGIQNNWTEMQEKHLPDALSSVEKIENADLFIKLITDSFEKIESEMGLQSKINTFNKFKSGYSATEDDISEKEFPEELKKAMEFIIYGADAYDPILTLEKLLRGNTQYKDLSFSEALKKFYENQVLLLTDLQKRASPKNKKNLAGGEAQLEILKNILDNLVELQKDPVAYQKMRTELRRFVYRTKHPYIAAESNENSHATHVSGVIAKQHPSIRIVPVRVTTQSVALAKEHKDEIQENILSQFKEFMHSPYFEPLKSQIASEYGGIKVTDSQIINKLEKYLTTQSLNGVFISDVIQAVSDVGAEQVKLANVSLGTTFKKNYSLDQKIPSMVEDIFSEFARFQIGKTIQEKAPGTLFMIATGNDGGWIDGISKSAFPVGITSLRMIKIAKERSLAPSPNNSIKNVLAVASINQNGTLTPFTNLLLDPNIPQIFSTGEEIMSSVPSKSTSAALKVVTGKTIRLSRLLAKMDFIRNKLDDALPFSKKPVFDYNDLVLRLKFPTAINESLAALVHLGSPVNRASMSGTSMATPTVTGLIARHIADRMQAENIQSDQIYNDPSFSPEKIIDAVMKMSRTNDLTPTYSVKMLIENINKWKPAKNQKIQLQTINRMFKPVSTKIRCEAVFAL